MSTVAPLPREAFRESAGAILGHRTTKLLPSLFYPMDVARHLTVLEIGVALPETVAFFSAFKCRLHFVDLLRESCVREQAAEGSSANFRAAFERQLDLPAGTRLDLCLFWDFLCYLDDPALKAFAGALRPWLHSGTRAHGFGVHHRAVRIENRHYGILSADTLTVRERHSDMLAHHPHSQVEMHELFDAFDFDRGLMLSNGKLELLMKARA